MNDQEMKGRYMGDKLQMGERSMRHRGVISPGWRLLSPRSLERDAAPLGCG